MLLKIIIALCVQTFYVGASGIFNENAKVLFKPNMEADYFGYSIILNPHGLIVGAPKSKNYNMKFHKTTGQVYNCSFADLDSKISSCSVISSKTSLNRALSKNFYNDNMWLGGSIASVDNDRLLICAPRSTSKFKEELLAPGDCYIWSPQGDMVLTTLHDYHYQQFLADETRPEYQIILESNRHLNFFAFGQAGTSIKIISKDNFIIGAPGLMHWTGGIISYYFDGVKFSRDDVRNTYYTKDLGPDEYFGYSVESGVFQRDGKTLIVGGAPRSANAYGQVLIINQQKWYSKTDPLDVVARIRGPQLGSYFGASLCCVDIDGDGVSDLLVGAPNYVKKDGGLPFDQGAVFLYLTKQTESSFVMEMSSVVTGSEASGARFGTAISGLGDVDGDGFNDVAIAAPWENNGAGAVYIYKGTSKGLQERYTQKLEAEGTSSFGIALSNAVDVDDNHCNDLAIGAAKSSSVYLYRCVPTIKVNASIMAPSVLNLPFNVTSFSANFCASVDSQPSWPDVQAGFKIVIEVDPDEKRAYLSDVTKSRIILAPEYNACEERTINIEPTAYLRKPISIDFFLEPDDLLKSNLKAYDPKTARVSEDSVLHSSHLIQLTRVCRDNKFCSPGLVMTLESFNDSYIPGASDTLGAKLSILNIAQEPAYGTKVIVTLPASPKRLPSSCIIKDHNLVTMTCDIPEPLQQDETVSWDIDLEYKYSQDTELKIVAKIFDSFNRNITNEGAKELTIKVAPDATFNVIGKPLPNNTIVVSRKLIDFGVSKGYDSEYFLFTHHYEITNFGPSDWISLDVQITLSEMVILANPIIGCAMNSTIMLCNWYLTAKGTKTVDISLHLDLQRFGDVFLEQSVLNVTTGIVLDAVSGNTTAEIMTVFVLAGAPLIWPVIVGGVAGVIVLGVLVYIMHRMGFFSRPKRQGFNELGEQPQPGTSASNQSEESSSSPQ